MTGGWRSVTIDRARGELCVSDPVALRRYTLNSGGEILLVSTEKTKAVYTGRVNASDVHKI